MNDPFARLGLAMVRWRWVVIGVWLLIVVCAGGLLAPRTSEVLKAGGFFAPNAESTRAARVLDREFNAATENNVVAYFRSPTLTVDDPAFGAEVSAADERLRGVPNVRGVDSFFAGGNPFLVAPDRQTAISIVTLDGEEGELPKIVPDLRAALGGVSLEHYITGAPAVNADLQETSEHDLRRAEMITIPLVMILLLVVFRTLIAAALPLMLGLCSVVTALAAMYLLSFVTDISIFALNTASMMGLGLGTDFSLMMVGRFRDELDSGRDPEQAVAVTMATAGRSVAYSAITVALGLLLLTLLFNLMLVRSISLAVMLVSLGAFIAAMTLLPAVLAVLGHRINMLRVTPRRRSAAAGGFWYRLSHRVMRRPWAWLLVSLGILLAAAVPLKDFDVIGATSDALPPAVESARGARALNEAFASNRLNPIQVVVETTEPGGVWSPAFLETIVRLHESIAADPRVDEVYSLRTVLGGIAPDQVRTVTRESVLGNPALAPFTPRFVNTNDANDTAILTIVSKHGQYEGEHKQLVRDLRARIVPDVRQTRVYDVKVGGDAAVFLDFTDQLYGRFPYLAAAVMLMTFVMLMMFFQSVPLPLKAIFLNLVSIAATFGILVLIFVHGVGADLLGFTELGALTTIMPVIIFATLFSLSTDYEVFMLSRVKEYYQESGNNEEAVAAGMEHTAGVVTAAGLILVGVYGSFAIARVVPIKELGLGLSIGVLIDSTIVRVIMVPATMRLMGGSNWWMPAWLKKIVPEIKEGGGFDLVPAAAITTTGNGRAAIAAGAGGAHGPMTPAATAPAGRADSGGRGSPGTRSWRMPVGQLRPVGGSIGAEVVVLPRAAPFFIGRDDGNELQLFDTRVSRVHARIDYVDGQYVLTDNVSTNGVHLNGKRITAPSVLEHGDRVEIGNMDSIFFTFEYGLPSRTSTVMLPV